MQRHKHMQMHANSYSVCTVYTHLFLIILFTLTSSSNHFMLSWKNYLKISGELNMKNNYKCVPPILSVPSNTTIPSILSLWIQLPVMMQSPHVLRLHTCQ